MRILAPAGIAASQVDHDRRPSSSNTGKQNWTNEDVVIRMGQHEEVARSQLNTALSREAGFGDSADLGNPETVASRATLTLIRYPLDMPEIILLGASGGIGQYIVRNMAAEHRIIGTHNRADTAGLAPGAEYHHVDVSSTAQLEQFAATVSSALKQPVLVYTPGVSLNATVHKLTDADWDTTINVNLSGAMRATRAFLPIMRSRGWGRVIYLSSVLARQGVPGTAAYSVTKAGLGALARVVSSENASKGITANALALGYFRVGIIQAVPETFLSEQVIPGIPMGKLGDPKDIVSAVKFAIEADYLTGATVDVSGGMFAP